MGLFQPRGRPAEIHHQQGPVSESKIQNGGLETVRRFYALKALRKLAQGCEVARPARPDLPWVTRKKQFHPEGVAEILARSRKVRTQIPHKAD